MLTIVGAATLLLAACSTAPMNEPLKQSALNDGPGGITVGGYRPTALPHAESSDQLLVLLASSGGASVRPRSPTVSCAACATSRSR
jgi:hypothetical protein